MIRSGRPELLKAALRAAAGVICLLEHHAVRPTLVQHPFRLDYYNIRDDNLPDVQKWRRAYQYDIPVVHLNGKGEHTFQRERVRICTCTQTHQERSLLRSSHLTEIARHRLDKDTLLAKLREASSE